MIILLTLIVIGLSKLLWWLKDYFKHEPFTTEPSQDEMLATGFNEIPSSEMQQTVLDTPVVETPQIEAEYQRDVREGNQRAEDTESTFRQSVQGMFAIDPTVPIEDQLATGGGAGAPARAPTESSPAEEAEFQTLVQSMQTTALDQCFQRQCASVQANTDETCRGFAEQCYYRLDRNVSKCLKSLDERCSTAALEGCRTACQQKATATRHRLNQGETLEANHRLSSLSGSTHLLLRDTGHLELYYRGRLLWSSASRNPSVQGTLNQGPYTLLVDPTGSLVIKNGLQMTTWATNTWLDPLKAGSIHAPYQCVVGEQRAVLLNNEGAILWDSQNDT